MTRKVAALLKSLRLRLLLPLFITGVVVFAVYAAISLRTTRENFLGLVAADADRTSDLIRRATHDGMLLNRKDEVQRILERLGEAPEVARIRIYDKRGRIFLSSHRQEVGQRLAITSEPCRMCHGEDGRRIPADVTGRTPLPQVVQGEKTLRNLSLIENEPGCATAACHAHQNDRPVLGVLDVEMSMEPLVGALGSARRQTLWATVSLVLVTLTVAAVFIHRAVLRPVAQLHEGTRRIAAGDLTTHIDILDHGELAELGRAFNQMAEDLEAARREITQWSQRLEEKVVEKTEDLRRTQQQVLHMERMASLGKLSATVAHELNNPITGILMYARLVERELGEQPLDSGLKDELGRYLKLMQQECRRCGTIVQNLLLFARRSGAEMAPLDLGEVVERSLLLMRHHMEMHNVRLHSEMPAQGEPVVADAGQLEQALVALLVNAVEAMSGGADGGGGDLTVRLEGGEDEVTLEVADTGVGIPPEVRPHIFEPFFSTKDKESGVGLGLSVVYGIVHRHGGRIEVESEVGRGTVFRLHLPRRPPPAAPGEGRGDAAAEPVAAVRSGERPPAGLTHDGR